MCAQVHSCTMTVVTVPDSRYLCSPQYVQSPTETMSSPHTDYMMVDVYSYAMVVWHIFTRQLPYGGKEMVMYEIVTQILLQGKVSAEPSQCG